MNRLTLGDASSRIVDVLRYEYGFTDRTIIEWILTAKYVDDLDGPSGSRNTIETSHEIFDRLILSSLHVLMDLKNDWTTESGLELDDDGVDSFDAWMECHGSIPADISNTSPVVRNLSWQDRGELSEVWLEWAIDLCGSGRLERGVHDFANGVVYSLRPGLIADTLDMVLLVVRDLNHGGFIWT